MNIYRGNSKVQLTADQPSSETAISRWHSLKINMMNGCVLQWLRLKLKLLKQKHTEHISLWLEWSHNCFPLCLVLWNELNRVKDLLWSLTGRGRGIEYRGRDGRSTKVNRGGQMAEEGEKRRGKIAGWSVAVNTSCCQLDLGDLI